MNTNNSLSFVRFNKWGVIFTSVFAVVIASALFIAPRNLNHTKAETCSPLYDQPIFNPYPITSDQASAGSDCTDFYTLAAHLGSESSSSYRTGVSAQSGDEIFVRVYIHNGARQDLGDQTTMSSARADANVTESGVHVLLRGTDINGNPVASKDADISIQIPAGASLEVEPGTGQVSGGTPGQAVEEGNSVSAFFNDFRACFEFASFLTFKVRVAGGAVPPPAAATGNVSIGSLNPNTSTCLYSGIVSWSAQNTNEIELTGVDPDNGQERSMLRDGPNGSTNFIFFQPDKNFTFNLYDVQSGSRAFLGSASIRPQPLSCGGGAVPPPAPTTVTLVINKTSFCVGESPTYAVAASLDALGKQVFWTSTFNGQTTAEDNNGNGSGYGQILTRGFVGAQWTGQGSAWQSGQIGSWTKTAIVNGSKSNTVSFTVINCATPPPAPTPPGPSTLALNLDKSSYCVGDAPIYRVTGSPDLIGKMVFWSSTYNGILTAEDNNGNGSGYNQFLANQFGQAFFGGQGNPWTLNQVGTWTKTAIAGGVKSSPVSFTVVNCNPIVTPPNPQPNPVPVPQPNINIQTNTNNNCVNYSCNTSTSNNNYSYNNNSYSNYSNNNNSNYNNYNNNQTYQPPVYHPPVIYNYTPPTYYQPPVYQPPVYQPPVVLGTNVNLNFSKRAFNETKNVDATSVPASKEDFITYTLTVSNSGSAPANNFVVTDDLSGVLPYADIVDNGGGSLNGNVISFPGISIPAGGSVSRSFKVRVKFFLTDNLRYTMTNTYGNTVTVNINQPGVKGVFIAPKTGADTVGFVFASMVTSAFAIIRKRKYLTKLIFS